MEKQPKLTTEQIDAILSDFAQWLREAADLIPAGEPAPEFSWSRLVEQLVALRHEVHLHTKALRQQQEQVAELLRRLSESAPTRRMPAVDGDDDPAVRPILESLIELADIQWRAGAELQRIVENWNDESSAQDEKETGASSPPRRRFWDRLGGILRRRRAAPSSPTDADRALPPHGDGPRLRQKLSALAEGFAIAAERIHRTLSRHGLEAIPTIGRPFDPQTMEAIDVIEAGPEVRSGHVAGEIRRGYFWRGRVYRTALVQVAKAKESPREAAP